MRHKKHLLTKAQRLTYVDWDYNNVDTCPDLSGLRHRAFIPGGGPTYSPDVVFLMKCPTRVESTKGDVRDGIHYNLVRTLCEHAGIEDFYVTYLIKYEMSTDRVPHDAEVKQALLYVREELSILDPLVIVLVGQEMHELILPGMPYSDTQYKVMYGVKGTYITIPDVLLARRNTNAFLDMQDEFGVLAEIIETL